MSLLSEEKKPEKRDMLWLFTTCAFTLVGMIILVALGFWRYGSLSGSLSRLAGDRLIPAFYAKSFGEMDLGRRTTIYFELRNTADRPIELLGASSSCSCTVAGRLPTTIPPSGSHKVPIEFRARQRGSYSVKVRLYTDFPGQPTLTLVIDGKVK